MVLASLSPLFVIWAIGGPATPFSGLRFEILCAGAVVVPNLIWLLRLKIAQRNKDTVRRTVGVCTDSSHHLFTYLLTMLMPLYAPNMESPREFLAVLFALAVIVLLFWRFNLHYMNIFLALCGYNILTIQPQNVDNPVSSMTPSILVSKKNHFQPGETIVAYRLSNTVLWEKMPS